MSSGRPWSLNTCFRYRRAVSLASTWVVVGQKCALLGSQSTPTRVALEPAGLGRPTMKSIDTEDQGAGGMGSGCSCPWGLCRVALFLAQVSQVFTYSLTIFRMPGQ